MKLKCKINGVEYPLVQGVTFSEEYNETLDSASIIIDQVSQIKELKPYDDVFIYDNAFNGYGRKKIIYDKTEAYKSGENFIINIETEFINEILNDNLLNYDFEIKLIDNSNVSTYHKCLFYSGINPDEYFMEIEESAFEKPIQLFKEHSPILNRDFWAATISPILNYADIKMSSNPYIIIKCSQVKNTFYKHFLVDSFDEEIINLDDEIYKYKINLFSETKKLEKIQIPNFSITQPLDYNLKKSIYDYMVDIVDMYSPEIKKILNAEEKTWFYYKKYLVDPSLKDIFGDTFSPDFSLNNPSLRDILTHLMQVKDMIPYVEDDIIKGLDITKRTKKFDLDPKYVNFVNCSQNSGDFCTSLKKTYSDALSQDNSCRFTEFLSFRNSDSPILTLENLSIETRFPIYKINKMYLCYYKTLSIGTVGIPSDKAIKKIFLCKQDISKLMKLDYERNVLKEDWIEFYEKNKFFGVDSLSKYKFSTIGYSIGSKKISGWGQKFNYLNLSFWSPKKTYLQNIIENMDALSPFGIYNYDYVKEKLQLKDNQFIIFDQPVAGLNKVKLISPFSNYALSLKSIFFEMDYNAFYNGTIYHSKNIDRDDLVTNDNSSSSLTILEKDGVMEKEKAERFGNKTLQINARYDNISQIQPLGSVFEKGYDKDIIIYHREYSVFDNTILCRYIGSKDYVLKNYFTSVFAKHRTYNLMSYGESVRRSENKKTMIFLSENEQFLDAPSNLSLNFLNFDGLEINKILSCFVGSNVDSDSKVLINNDKINYGYLVYKNKKYVSDINIFSCGSSLCFNIAMYDNVSSGVHIDTDNLEPKFNLEVKDDLVGSVQRWYLTVDSEKTGFVKKMGFYVGHNNSKKTFFEEEFLDLSESSKINGVSEKEVEIFNGEKYNKKVLNDNTSYKALFELPYIKEPQLTNIIGGDYLVQKDNKELIDMTFQLEPVTISPNIFFSSYFLSLSDLNGSFDKFEQKTITRYFKQGKDTVECKLYESVVKSFPQQLPTDSKWTPEFTLVFDPENFAKFEKNPLLKIKTKIDFPSIESNFLTNGSMMYYAVLFEDIVSYDKNEGLIIVNILQDVVIADSGGKPKESYKNEKTTLKLHLVKDHKEQDDFLSENAIIFRTNFETIYSDPNFSGYDRLYYDFKNPNGKQEYTNFKFFSARCATNPREKYWLASKPEPPRIIIEGSLTRNNSQFRPLFVKESENFVYEQNLFVLLGYNPIVKSNIFNKYKTLEELSQQGVISQTVSSEVFIVENSCITIDLLRAGATNFDTTKSISLWYLDNGGTFNFVFGNNITREEIEKEIKKIYISLLTHKDLRIFDNLNNFVGKVKNISHSSVLNDKYEQKYIEKN